MSKITAELHNWRKHICREDGSYVLWGFIYNDVRMRFPDGHWIHTGIVKEMSDEIAVTRSGSIYGLFEKQDAPEIVCY